MGGGKAWYTLFAHAPKFTDIAVIQTQGSICECHGITGMSGNLAHARTVCTRPSIPTRGRPGNEANLSPNHWELVKNHSEVFALGASELGTTNIVTHIIDTGNHAPIRQPMRHIPFSLRNQVDQLVSDVLSEGVIQPSSSPSASPIELVRKKDGGTRFCLDYRKLNAITKLDEYPLPRIDDTLDLLAGTRYFIALDLASRYWQVAMDNWSQEKTAFSTYAGLYEFQRMPFGPDKWWPQLRWTKTR